jgi:hypothetical protein
MIITTEIVAIWMMIIGISAFAASCIVGLVLRQLPRKISDAYATIGAFFATWGLLCMIFIR